MKKNTLLLFVISLSMLSCKNMNADDTFLGTWAYSNLVPLEHIGGLEGEIRESSMRGQTCTITKVENSDHSYYVHIINDNKLLFTEENDSTLRGIAANFQIKYIRSSQHIIFKVSADKRDGIEYKKVE